MSGETLHLFLIQVLVVLGLARLLGELFRRFDQPPLAGEILAGVLLGKTVLGHVAPELYAGLFPSDDLQRALFDVVAQVGILFLLLVIGIEVDVASAWKLRHQSLAVAVTGVVVPLGLGFACAWVLYPGWAETPVERLPFSLYVGAAVAITAITVVARRLFDLRIVKSDLGLLLLSALAINDVLGWVVFGVVMGMLGAGTGAAEAGASTGSVASVVLGAVAFAGVCGTLGRRAVTRMLRGLEERGLPSPATPLSFVVCLGLACGVATHLMGLHPIFGFLIAGVMAGDPAALSEHTRSVITQMVEAVFVPLFFAGIALHVDFVTQFDPMLVLVVTALSILGKFLGAWLGTWLVSMPAFDRVPVAIAHIPGGSMGVLLAVVGKEAGLIGPAMFVAIVFASIVSSLLVGPAFSWSLRRRAALNVLGFFSRQGIVPALGARERYAAIEELVARACEMDPRLDRMAVLRAVRAREETMGTGVGGGIAVPHARLDGLPRPRVVLGVSREGIDWNAVDGQPAHLVFLILTPADEQDTQLEILATIARAMARPEARDLLVDATTPEEIWRRLELLLRRTEGRPGGG